MSEILKALRFSAQNLSFLTPLQLERRAKLVEEDFKAVGLKYDITCQMIPVPGWSGQLPYGSYGLLGSECSINNAGRGDRRHIAMSGGGLDRECILYYSKISEWANTHIPHLWPSRLKKDLRDPNKHLNTVCEVWWLSRLVGADYSTVEHSVPIDPAKPKGKNFDWNVRLPGMGVTLRMEVKRRPGDIGRFVDVPHMKKKSVFDDLGKFPPASPPNEVNVGCVRLFAPITNEVRYAVHEWLKENPNVSAVALHAPSPTASGSFAVIAQSGLGYLELLFSPPDREDNTYIAPFCFARDVPGVQLPDPNRNANPFRPVSS